jgi:hypothetical protein
MHYKICIAEPGIKSLVISISNEQKQAPAVIDNDCFSVKFSKNEILK